MFYSTVSDTNFDEIEALGGVAHHYLSHHDEAGPIVGSIQSRFVTRVYGGSGDTGRISQVADNVD